MEVNADSLVPGMVLGQDLLGKSGNPIIEKDTILTESHIDFIKHFLFTKVDVSSVKTNETSVDKEVTAVTEILINQTFKREFELAVNEYEKLFTAWQNQVPFSMYKIREIFIPLFEDTIEQPFQSILSLLQPSSYENLWYRSCGISILAVYLANKLDYEKKDWLQIGFASLLSDSGIAKMDAKVIHNRKPLKEWQLHPIYSYKLVENESTLTSNAKVSILQHHEYLDGSGFPARSEAEKIQPYARIIAICDFFYSVYSQNVEETINILKENKEKKFDSLIVNKLVKELSSLL